MLRWHPRSIEAMARPAAERSADWFERQKHALRNRFGGIEIGAGNAAEVRRVESVRIAGSSGAFTGPARVIDGDTLDVGGVRIRLHGIDAPESKQNCRAGGKRWSCGREATRALAARIRGRSVACQERDRDRYGRVVAACSLSGMDLNGWMVAQRLGLRLPAVFVCIRCRGVWSTGSETGHVARRRRAAMGLAQGRAPRRDAGDNSAEQRAVHHQGQHRQERHAHLPRAGRAVLRADSNQHVEGGSGGFCTEDESSGGRVAALTAVARRADDAENRQPSVRPRRDGRGWMEVRPSVGTGQFPGHGCNSTRAA